MKGLLTQIAENLTVNFSSVPIFNEIKEKMSAKFRPQDFRSVNHQKSVEGRKRQTVAVEKGRRDPARSDLCGWGGSAGLPQQACCFTDRNNHHKSNGLLL